MTPAFLSAAAAPHTLPESWEEITPLGAGTKAADPCEQPQRTSTQQQQEQEGSPSSRTGPKSVERDVRAVRGRGTVSAVSLEDIGATGTPTSVEDVVENLSKLGLREQHGVSKDDTSSNIRCSRTKKEGKA